MCDILPNFATANQILAMSTKLWGWMLKGHEDMPQNFLNYTKMEINNILKENVTLFSMFDDAHQQMLKPLEDVCSVWFMNILMRTLLQHKCSDTGCEGASDEDIQILTHADKSIILEYLALYIVSKMDSKAENALKKELGEFREIHIGDQLDSLLLVLYNLLDMDWKEFRHHSPVINEGKITPKDLN